MRTTMEKKAVRMTFTGEETEQTDISNKSKIRVGRRRDFQVSLALPNYLLLQLSQYRNIHK